MLSFLRDVLTSSTSTGNSTGQTGQKEKGLQRELKKPDRFGSELRFCKASKAAVGHSR
jgi:hypothetical protein